LKITREADYAVRCCQHMCQCGMGVMVKRGDISEAMEIPSPFLGKIAQKLAKAGIVEIIRGAQGGYRLLVPPEDLSLLRVIEAVMGEIYLSDCLIDKGMCGRGRNCSVHPVWSRVRDQLRCALDETSMAGLL